MQITCCSTTLFPYFTSNNEKEGKKEREKKKTEAWMLGLKGNPFSLPPHEQADKTKQNKTKQQKTMTARDRRKKERRKQANKQETTKKQETRCYRPSGGLMSLQKMF